MFLLNNTELFLLGITLIGFVILSLYYLIAYARPLRASRRTDDTLEEGNKLPVSIIIYAKNDSENLKKHLPALLTQDYPEYQVVVINDGSSDDTDDTLKFFQNEYKHLYHTYVPSDARYLSRRKLAFTLGVKAAKYDILLFTEANCQPLIPLDTQGISYHPLLDSAIRIMVERVHIHRAEAIYQRVGIPTFPNRGCALQDRV